MKIKKIKFITVATIAFTIAIGLLNKPAEAEDLRVTPNEAVENMPVTGSAVTGGGAVTEGSSIETASHGSIMTTGSAVNAPEEGTEEEETTEEKTTPVEVDDEFTLGGIFYMVTEIKGEEVYVEVTGVVNDKTTTVYIPAEIEYNDVEMTVSSIGEEAFSDLERLRKVIVAADITDIGKNAFKGSAKFSRLIIKTKGLKKVGKNIFKGVSDKLILEVPQKSLGAYRKLFKNKGIKLKEVRAIK